MVYQGRPQRDGRSDEHVRDMIYNDHIASVLGVIPITTSLRAILRSNRDYSDLFDYRILSYPGIAIVLVQRRDVNQGWGQPLAIDLYERDRLIGEKLPIGCSDQPLKVLVWSLSALR